MAGGMCMAGGYAWQGACMVWVHGGGACVTGGMHGKGAMHGRGALCDRGGGACMARGHAWQGGGACVADTMRYSQ